MRPSIASLKCAIWRATYYLTRLELSYPEATVLTNGGMILPGSPVDKSDTFGGVKLEWAK